MSRRTTTKTGRTRKERKAARLPADELQARLYPKGFIRVPTHLFDYLFAVSLPGSFVRFILILVRLSIGWQTDFALVSARELETYSRSRNRAIVFSYIKALEACGLIEYTASPSPTDSDGGGKEKSKITLLSAVGYHVNLLALFHSVRDVVASGGNPNKDGFDPDKFAGGVKLRYQGFLKIISEYDDAKDKGAARKVGAQARLSQDSIAAAIAYVVPKPS
jgi:hypothetical protein